MNGAKMNKKGSVLTQLLIFLVVAIFSSALVLFLVKLGVLIPDKSEESILNTELIPYGREGSLFISEFQLCGFIENLECISPQDEFGLGQGFYIRFAVDSSVYNGEIKLTRNYELINPNENVVLQVDEKNNYHFDTKSNNENERVIITDFIPTRLDYL